jgi:molybdate transport repressor ModE-like protein
MTENIQAPKPPAKSRRQFVAGATPSLKIEARSKLWLVIGHRRIFGSGLARLLEGVEKNGTLRKAALTARMSYRYAWNLVRSAEGGLKARLLLPQAGGKGGGRSVLSPAGRSLLKLYRHMERETATFADERLAALLKKRGYAPFCTPTFTLKEFPGAD